LTCGLRTQPILLLRPGLPEKATHDYKRNGTTTLFAALEVATGTVTDRCYDRHGKAEFLDFLKHVANTHPRRQLHIVLDNYHTHKHDDINRWLTKHPRITLHFTPTSGSWLNPSKSSSGSSPAKPSAAAPSTASNNSSPPSTPSSTPTTTAVNPSPGPKQPTTFSPAPPVNQLQMRDTRSGARSKASWSLVEISAGASRATAMPRTSARLPAAARFEARSGVSSRSPLTSPACRSATLVAPPAVAKRRPSATFRASPGDGEPVPATSHRERGDGPDDSWARDQRHPSEPAGEQESTGLCRCRQAG